LLGNPGLGLTVGLGGLYLSITDMEGSTVTSLLIAVMINGIAVLAGTLIGGHIWFSIAAMFAWAFLAGLASAHGDVVMQIGFISTLAFAISLGVPGDLNTGVERMVLFIGGGAWGIASTLVLWRLDKQTGEPSEMPDTDETESNQDDAKHGVIHKFISNLTFRSIIFRHALRLAIASTIAVALFKLLRLERGYWLIITVVVIVKPVFADTRKRTMDRVIGSVGGGAMAALIAASIHNLVVLDILLVAFSILAYSQLRHNYGAFVLFLTPFIVLMIETVQPTDWRIAITRIVDTLIGSVIALTVSFLLRPKSAFRW
jgi:uncharacterized membrane protein YgaE (UPF0421/DUF939 family)